MKKFLAVVLSICISLTFFSPSVPAAMAVTPASDMSNTSMDSNQLTPAWDFNYEFLPASTKWLNYVSNEKPATFSEDKISYKLNDNVLLVDEAVTNSIASAGQLIANSPVQKLRPNSIVAEGGYIPVSVLDTAAAQKNREIENNTVVVDKLTGTAFKVVSPTIFSGQFDVDKTLSNLVKPLEGTYSIAKPELHEVVDSFKLDEDTIKLTRGNISGFAPNIEKNLVIPNIVKNMAFGDSLKDFKYLSDNPLIKLQFTNEKLQGKISNNSTIDVTLSGGLGIDGIELTGKYSGFGGYKIAMTLKQESYLVVELDAQVKEEVCVPILGIDVPFGIGRVSGGVFAIIGMDGTIRFEIEAREFTANTIGIQGSTKFYVPTSFHPIFNNDLKTDGDVELAGKTKGYIKFGPKMGMEIFGFDLVGAGVFLGAGLDVETTGKYLNVELYGIANIYIKIVGKNFTLMNYRPTILKRTQADTAGYRVKIMEAFLKPGRVGGTIQMETNDKTDADGYVPAQDIEYRILVVPQGVSFNADNPNDLNNDKIRKYPANGYAFTNEEGEFIQKNDTMCYNGDKVYLEFKANGESYFSDPVAPTLPFENISLTSADYFNDFATGQVQPVRVINWEAKTSDPPEQQYELAYYNNGLISISPFNNNIPGGQARTLTDEYGNFDTRIPLVLSGKIIPNIIDIRPTVSDESDFNILKWTIFDLTIDTHGTTHTCRIHNFRPTAHLNFVRVIDELEDSYKRYQEGNKVIDQMVYDEYIWIENPLGTRTVTEAEFDYSLWGFSTQDFLHRADDSNFANALSAFTGKNKWDNKPITTQSSGTKVLTPVLDENGEPTGTALFSQRVTVEWVWQPHPNPVKIIGDNHTQATTNGGTFQVKATGFAPFAYSLKGAPDGVTIDKNTGLMTIAANLPEKNYTYTIHVSENTALVPSSIDGKDIRKGNDASPPDEQLFTLTITKGDTPAVESAQPPDTTQPPSQTRTAPVIVGKTERYYYKMTSGDKDLVVPVKATGSEPITYSLVQLNSRQPIPTEASINPNTGVLTIKGAVKAGEYLFAIKASNDVGSDTKDFILNVTPAATQPTRTAPVIAEETHEYQFKKLIGGGDLVVQIRATGSTPIIYSLVATNSRQSIPPGVSIDSNTGVLTIKEGINAGQYFFAVKATNDAGSDTQDCRLDVMTLTPPTKPPTIPKLQLSSDNTPNLMLLAAPPEPDVNKNLPSLKPPISNTTPPNSIAIRCDHSEDVYTREQFTTNGATYIRWDSSAMITVEKEKTPYRVVENSPVGDQYHYYEQIDVPPSVIEEVKKSFSEKLSDYQRSDIFLGERLSSMNLLQDFNDLRVNPLDVEMFNLEYGSLIDTMNKQKGGSFNVDLGSQNGTYVTGKYFVGLQNNKKAVVSFRQNGAEITFVGKDIKKSSESDILNFAYTNKAPHEADILSNVDAGNESFTFGFAHHGELPGMATFNIATGMSQGTKVNIYKYDVESKKFIKIADNMTVGAQGVVTYKNNTMSEYLVTTQTLPNTKVLDEFASQNSAEGNYLWFFGLGSALILIGIAVWFFLQKKKQTRNL